MSDMKERLGLSVFAAGLVLAVGLGAGLWTVGDALNTRNAGGVNSTGSATIDATADTAVWTIYMNKQDQSVKTAVSGVLTNLDKLKAYLTNGGVSADDITVGGMTTNAVYGNNGPTGLFEANVNVRVRSKDPELIAKLNTNINQLLASTSDITLNTQAPEYYVSKLAELRPKVQELAVQDAQKRAKVMVEAIGGELGDPLKISSGAIQVLPQDTVEGDYGAYDLSTIKKTIRAVVNVTFEVD